MRNRIAMGALLIAALLIAVPAFAGNGKGGHGNGSTGGGGTTTPTATIALNQSSAALGSSVTFSVTYPTSVKTPRVEVLCYQGGALVYGEAGSPDYTFVLGGGGSLWLTAGGAASCVANLYYFTWNAGEPATTYLATTSFDAAG